MALIIEDGSGVLNANSYGTVVGARAYAVARAVVLSGTDSDVEAQLIKATDYLESLEYLGNVVLFTQSLQWPRQNLYYTYPDNPIASNVIPSSLINAQYQLVVEQQNGIDIEPTVKGKTSGSGAIVEKRVDVLMTRYSERIGTTSLPIMPKVDALLRGLILNTPTLRTVRI
jgi:hypothetical protein